MAATAWEANRIAGNADFQERTKHYMQEGAKNVRASDPAAAGFTERAAYADEVLAGNASVFEHSAAAMTNASLLASADFSQPLQGGFNISDSDLQFAVQEVWNAMSGYTPPVT